MALRWGIVGSGPVARKFVFGLRSVNMTATAVYSRTPATAAAFAREFGIGAVEPSVDALASRNDVEAVYIATPPSAHEAQALACIAAGKPVLIEKPFADSEAAARSIASAAQASGVLCMEAFWTRFLPLTHRLETLLGEGGIGELRHVSGSFGKADVPDPARNIFNPSLGGGALLHRGVYPLILAQMVAGPVAEVEATAALGPSGVDEDCVVTLQHESGTISTIAASLRTNLPNDLRVSGTTGAVHVEAPVFRPFRMRIERFRPSRGEPAGGRGERLREGGVAQGLQQRLSAVTRAVRRSARHVSAYYAGNGYGYEAEEIARLIAAGKTESPAMPLRLSLATMSIIDTARRQWTKGN